MLSCNMVFLREAKASIERYREDHPNLAEELDTLLYRITTLIDREIADARGELKGQIDKEIKETGTLI